MNNLIDTHCHIHSADYPLDREKTLEAALAAGVEKIICVGTSPEDIILAKSFAEAHPDHVFSRGIEQGLDYHYAENPALQKSRLIKHIDENRENPLIFHVRDAFDDFFAIIEKYQGLTGVIHSFSGTPTDAAHALKNGLYLGLSGLAVFKNLDLSEIPLEKIVLETDAPYLTPPPFRGKINQPAYVKYVADWVAMKTGRSVDEIARKTSENARKLFNL
jgi:TatD DNase family protein